MTDTQTQSPYAVGAIWYTSWGYDQTNVEYFEVVRETAKSVVLRRIGTEVVDGKVYPKPGLYVRDFHMKPNEDGHYEKMCRKGRGYSRASCKIDETRSAYPYEGGGQYDTLAAGHAGH